jgi:Lysyl oxidase
VAAGGESHRVSVHRLDRQRGKGTDASNSRASHAQLTFPHVAADCALRRDLDARTNARSIHGVRRQPGARSLARGGAARYELRPLGDEKPLRIRLKRGFCLYDSTPYELSLPGAPRKGAYPRDGCGMKPDLELAMGISIGWKDDYYWRIPGQDIDITDLPNGKYRLFTKVDPRNWWRESDESNNVTWIDIVIGDSLNVKVLRRSPKL